MQLFQGKFARKAFGFAALLLFSVPFGLSVSGCKKAIAVEYCNGGDSGPEVGQVATISLSQSLATYGESLNYGEIGQSLSASAVDCKGNTVSVNKYTYASTNGYQSGAAPGSIYADINPSTGQVCAGTWNRQTGGGVADYTVCTGPTTAPTNYIAYLTATAEGATSNSIPVFVHAQPNSIQIGNPSPQVADNISGYTVTTSGITFNTTNPPGVGLGVTLTNFPTSTFFNNQVVSVAGATTTSFTVANTFNLTAPLAKTETGNATFCGATANPSSNCCPLSYTAAQPSTPYTGLNCISQNQTGQVVSRVFDSAGNNITCQVGHITYQPIGGTNVVTFDENGVGTANQPGSATLTAAIAASGSSSTAGFWSTCSPKSITLTSNGSMGPVTGLLNVATPFNAVITDTNNNVITGLALEYESTTPETITGGSNNITPAYPGSTTITAVCAPPACNASPYSQIDLYSNGTTLTSNGVQFSATGQSSSVIYIGSTTSQYIYPFDFTTGRAGALVKLPYVPNSMVISLDGSSIYLGSASGLMTVGATANALASVNVSLTGPVISVSPSGTELVMTDPIHQTVSLVSSGGGLISTIGGVAMSAAWSPDNSTVYITTQASASYPAQVLVHNSNTSWTSYTVANAFTDVAVTVPHIGAYFAGTDTEGRSYCPTNTTSGTNTPASVTNAFYPVLNTLAVMNERIAATNDGKHMIGAVGTTLNDIALDSTFPYTKPCNPAPTTTPVTPTFLSTNTVHPLAGITATDISDVNVSSNSKAAFVTYTGTGALPLYLPGSGTVSNVTLSGTGSGPVRGVFSSDDAFFYVGTAGDNLVHIITMTYPASGNPSALDSGTLTPALPNFNNTNQISVPNLIVQRVKKPTT